MLDKSEFRVWMDGAISVVEVLGFLDEDAAANLLEIAAAAVTTCPAVQIDLDGVDSMTQGAAALLLSESAQRVVKSKKVTLRHSDHPVRHAVLRAYARSRAGAPQA